MKKISLNALLILAAGFSTIWACDCDNGSNSRSLLSASMIPGDSLYSMSDEMLVGVSVKDNDEEITVLAAPSSLNFIGNQRALHQAKRSGLYETNGGFDSRAMRVGDWVNAGMMRLEIAGLPELPENGTGYGVNIFKLGNDRTVSEKVSSIEVIGGYKRQLDDADYIPANAVQKGDVYVVNIAQLNPEDSTTVSCGKVYRFYDAPGKVSDNMWYYDDNGQKFKIEKLLSPLLEGDSNAGQNKILVKRKIFRDDSVEESSAIKLVKYSDADTRVVSKGRIKRGKEAERVPQSLETLSIGRSMVRISDTETETVFSTPTTEYYLDEKKDGKNAYGRKRYSIDGDGNWEIIEYNSILPGDMRVYKTSNATRLEDISGDGKIGIEDLKDTPVIVEKYVLTDWQGSRHTKSVQKTKGRATYVKSPLSSEYSVVLADERVFEESLYDHILTPNGGMIEQVTVKVPGENNEMQVAFVKGAEYPTLAMDVPISQFSTSAEGKEIRNSYHSYVNFSVGNFLSNGVSNPNYSSAPQIVASGGAPKSMGFTLSGVESSGSVNVNIPGKLDYDASNFALVDGESVLTLNLYDSWNSKTVIYSEEYVYLNGNFVLKNWTYNYYSSAQKLMGTYYSNGTYSDSVYISPNVKKTTDVNGATVEERFADATESMVLYKRELGVNSQSYGRHNDIVRVYSRSVTDTNGMARMATGAQVESVWASSQVGGSGAANASNDMPIYQTYKYLATEDIATLEIDRYGVAITRDYTRDMYDGQPSTEVRTNMPGFYVQAPYKVIRYGAKPANTIYVKGRGVVNQHMLPTKTHYTNVKTHYTNEEVMKMKVTSGNAARGVVGVTYYVKDMKGNLLEYAPYKTSITSTKKLGVAYAYTPNQNLKKAVYTNGAFYDIAYVKNGIRYVSSKPAPNIIAPPTNNTEVVTTESGDRNNYVYKDGGIWMATVFSTSDSESDLSGIELENALPKGSDKIVFERISGFGADSPEYGKLITEAETRTSSGKFVSRIYLKRSEKLKTTVESTFRYVEGSSGTMRLAKENVRIELNGRFVKSVTKSFSESSSVLTEVTNLYFYDHAGREIMRSVYGPSGERILDEGSYYHPGRTTTVGSVSVASQGRLLGRSIKKGSMTTGYRYEYIGFAEKNEGMVREYIVSSEFDGEGRPLGVGRKTKFAYNDMGYLYKTWGDGTLPRIYLYDDLARPTELLTLNADADTAGYNADGWPSALTEENPDVVRVVWEYNEDGDIVSKKVKQGANELSSMSMTYDEAASSMTLTLPDGKSMTYVTDLLDNTVSKTGQDFSVEYIYDDFSRVIEATTPDGTYTKEYSQSDTKLASLESMPDGYSLERTIDNDGNMTSLKLFDENSNEVYAAEYNYSMNGKLAEFSALGKTVSYTYDSYGMLSQRNMTGGLRFAFSYNSLGLSEVALYSGDSELRKNVYFVASDRRLLSQTVYKNGAADGNWTYGYASNAPGLKYAAFNQGDTSTPKDPYFREEYAYDLKGNITKFKKGEGAWNSTASNSLDQIGSIQFDTSSVYPLRGITSENAQLNVYLDDEFQDYSQVGENFVFTMPADIPSASYVNVKIESLFPGVNPTPKTMKWGNLYRPENPETFSYDLAGNLISDSRWNYRWNADNRLIRMEASSAAVSTGAPNEKYEYKYDWQGRKIQALKFIWKEGEWSLYSTNKRYYDQWNLIYETVSYADSHIEDEAKRYFYGLDIEGTMHVSGGTGGLLMMSANDIIAYVFNGYKGNVEGLYSADDGRMLADYTYSPFGELLLSEGALASTNKLRYSSRYAEPGNLYYYGHRHFSPKLRKWLSKDPLMEVGGINLYVIADNDVINKYDLLGLDVSTDADKCNIYIVVGHSIGNPNDPSPSGVDTDDGVGSRIQDMVNAANKSGGAINPCNTAFGAVSCFSTQSNAIANNAGYGFVDPSNTDSGIDYARDPETNPNHEGGSMNQKLRGAYENAKTKRKSMCADTKQCCSSVTITVGWHGPEDGTAVYNMFKNFEPKKDPEKCNRR